MRGISIPFCYFSSSIARKSIYTTSQLIESQSLKSPYQCGPPLLPIGSLAGSGQLPYSCAGKFVVRLLKRGATANRTRTCDMAISKLDLYINRPAGSMPCEISCHERMQLRGYAMIFSGERNIFRFIHSQICNAIYHRNPLASAICTSTNDLAVSTRSLVNLYAVGKKTSFMDVPIIISTAAFPDKHVLGMP